jgi:methyl-accepting chemotaxis protein
MIDENSVSIRQMAGSSQALENLAHSLQRSVGRFKI